MSADELLGSDNQSRAKELAKNTLPAENILNNLASADPSVRRDAALIIYMRACEKPPTPKDGTLIDALAETLKSPRAEDGTGDVLALAASAEASLAALWSLDAEPSQAAESLLLSIVAYAEPSQPWTTRTAAATAERLLDRHGPGEKKQEFIITGILQSHLRPIFSKTTSSVTAQGRPALFREPPPPGGFHAQKAAWKEAGPHTVGVFHWAMETSEPETIKKHWPLYVPVLVTLAEDDDVAIRQRGVDILSAFLTKCPADVLRASGIDTVFQEAVFPSLLFLPSLTPEAESATLLRSSYRVLRQLARAADSDPAGQKRRALLDKMLRDGVLAGYFHASQHVRVVEVLMQATADIIESLHVYAAKHLQSLLDLFAPVLTDAFALAYAPAVVAAAKALNTAILNCWPRIVATPHAEQIINIVSRCWTNVHDARESSSSSSSSSSSELDMLEKELKRTMALLAALWQSSDEPTPKEKLAQVVQKAPHLRPLFQPFQLEKVDSIK